MPWGEPQGDRRAWWLSGAASVIASAPLLWHLPFFLGADAPLMADAASHAAIAQSIAQHGVPHGWIDTYDGGFPLGVSYPPVGWLAGALLIRLGVPTATAIQALGIMPYLIAPPLVLLVGRAAGARPLAALAGALAVAWIAPFSYWLGTAESYIGLGLLSQALAVPLVLLAARAAVAKRGAWQLPLLAATLVATHPQIAVAAALSSAPALALGRRELRRRLLSGFAAAGAAGLALYGPGIARLEIPFGWPTRALGVSWIAGYRLETLYDWVVEGRLFDQRRAPAITSIWVLCTLTLAALARHRIPRLVLVTFVWTIGLTFAGRGLLLLGEGGERILSFLQPQRVLALVPFAMAAVVVVACEELLARGARLRAVPGLERHGHRWVPGLIAFALVPAALLGVQTQAQRFGAAVAEGTSWRSAEERGCGLALPALAWAGSLDVGRLTTIEEAPLWECAKHVGVELRSAVPLGYSIGAGSHVGILAQAFGRLRLDEPGSAARAEALGVRWVLHGRSHTPWRSDAWRTRAATETLQLSERLGGTDLVGVGCVESRWRGAYASLRQALSEDLGGAAQSLADPRSLVEIEHTKGPLVREALPRGACDAANATVVERRREPGAYEATVDAPAEVDVVIRATATRDWTVHVDGRPTPTRVVAPGFVSVRVPPGEHEIYAEVAWPPGYGAGLTIAAGAVGALAFFLRRRDEPARHVPRSRLRAAGHDDS